MKRRLWFILSVLTLLLGSAVFGAGSTSSTVTAASNAPMVYLLFDVSKSMLCPVDQPDCEGKRVELEKLQAVQERQDSRIAFAKLRAKEVIQRAELGEGGGRLELVKFSEGAEVEEGLSLDDPAEAMKRVEALDATVPEKGMFTNVGDTVEYLRGRVAQVMASANPPGWIEIHVFSDMVQDFKRSKHSREDALWELKHQLQGVECRLFYYHWDNKKEMALMHDYGFIPVDIRKDLPRGRLSPPKAVVDAPLSAVDGSGWKTSFKFPLKGELKGADAMVVRIEPADKKHFGGVKALLNGQQEWTLSDANALAQGMEAQLDLEGSDVQGLSQLLSTATPLRLKMRATLQGKQGPIRLADTPPPRVFEVRLSQQGQLSLRGEKGEAQVEGKVVRGRTFQVPLVLKWNAGAAAQGSGRAALSLSEELRKAGAKLVGSGANGAEIAVALGAAGGQSPLSLEIADAQGDVNGRVAVQAGGLQDALTVGVGVQRPNVAVSWEPAAGVPAMRLRRGDSGVVLRHMLKFKPQLFGRDDVDIHLALEEPAGWKAALGKSGDSKLRLKDDSEQQAQVAVDVPLQESASSASELLKFRFSSKQAEIIPSELTLPVVAGSPLLRLSLPEQLSGLAGTEMNISNRIRVEPDHEWPPVLPAQVGLQVSLAPSQTEFVIGGKKTRPEALGPIVIGSKGAPAKPWGIMLPVDGHPTEVKLELGAPRGTQILYDGEAHTSVTVAIQVAAQKPLLSLYVEGKDACAPAARPVLLRTHRYDCSLARGFRTRHAVEAKLTPEGALDALGGSLPLQVKLESKDGMLRGAYFAENSSGTITLAEYLDNPNVVVRVDSKTLPLFSRQAVGELVIAPAVPSSLEAMRVKVVMEGGQWVWPF